MARKLTPLMTAKPWGRSELAPWCHNQTRERIGEVRFGGEPAAELAVKFIFTSQPLSVQVHPDDDDARADGVQSGKDEAWYILDAAPHASILLGPQQPTTREALAASLTDGGIERLLASHEVAPGQTIYVPAGTIHAIGAGLTLIEIAQNVDITYRLYDYERQRELRVEAALKCATINPYAPSTISREISANRTVLAVGGRFVVEKWTISQPVEIALPSAGKLWFTPVCGAGSFSKYCWKPGEVWTLDGNEHVEVNERTEILVAYPGGVVAPHLLNTEPSAIRKSEPCRRRS